jgi:hypothetical protein
VGIPEKIKAIQDEMAPRLPNLNESKKKML